MLGIMITLLAFGGRGTDDQALASVGHQWSKLAMEKENNIAWVLVMMNMITLPTFIGRGVDDQALISVGHQ